MAQDVTMPVQSVPLRDASIQYRLLHQYLFLLKKYPILTKSVTRFVVRVDFDMFTLLALCSQLLVSSFDWNFRYLNLLRLSIWSLCLQRLHCLSKVSLQPIGFCFRAFYTLRPHLSLTVLFILVRFLLFVLVLVLFSGILSALGNLLSQILEARKKARSNASAKEVDIAGAARFAIYGWAFFLFLFTFLRLVQKTGGWLNWNIPIIEAI